MNINNFRKLFALALPIFLIGCGEGFVSSVSGVVAVGAPVPNATITLTDASGTTRTTTADANGNYALDTFGLKAPFVIAAAGALGSQEISLNSVVPVTSSPAAATANVTPLTTALSALISSSGGQYNPESVTPSQVTAQALQQAKNTLLSAIAPALAQANVSSSSFDPVSTPFTPNRTGADQVLDVVDVKLRPYGIALSNRLEALGGESDPRNVVLGATGVTGTWTDGVAPASAAMNRFEQQLNDCLAQPVATRATSVQRDVGGFMFVPSMNDLSPTCRSIVYSTSPGVYDYIHNSYAFNERWGGLLGTTDFEGARALVNLRYVVQTPLPNYPGDGNAYVVNINVKDKFGNWYTRPEALVRQTIDGVEQFRLFGNRRPLDFSVDPNFTYIHDLASPTNSRVEGRFQFNIAPHRSVTGLPQVDTNGRQTWPRAQFFYDSSATDTNTGYKKPLPKLVCGWITGPFLQKSYVMVDGKPVFHEHNSPKGGILIKIPNPDVANIRNYMPVHAKYSADFDPINDYTNTSVGGTITRRSHRQMLYDDCKGTTGTSPANYVSTANTNNQYTIHGYKTDSSDWSYSSNSSNNGVEISGTTVPGHTYGTLGTCISGNCPRQSYVNFRPTPVTADEISQYQSAYGSTAMPRFTAFFFKADEFTNSTTVDPWGSLAIFWDNKVTFANGIRMVGSMPFVPNRNGAYDDSIKFRKLANSTLTQYLPASLPALAAGTSVNLIWQVPPGTQGIDRFGGITRSFYTLNNRDYIIIPSVAQISTGVLRTATQGSFTIPESWPGTAETVGQTVTAAGWGTSNTTVNGYSVSKVYRELWTRSYDIENRQIQYVATRITTAP